MAKWLAGMVRFAAVLLILVLLGYNTIEIAALKTEVAALKADNRRIRSEADNRDNARQDEGAIAAARRHMDRAQELLRQGKFAEAQREARRAAEVVRQATDDARAGGEGTLRRLRGEVDELSRKAESLWKRHDGESRTSAPKARNQP